MWPSSISIARWQYSSTVAIWWVVFAFGAIAAGSVAQWTIIGAVLLTLLFIGSTVFTESISGSKYPEYADYRRSVSAIVPWFPKRVADRRTGEGGPVENRIGPFGAIAARVAGVIMIAVGVMWL